MYPLYAILLLGSLSVPFLYALFIKNFILHWKEFCVSTTAVATVFLMWDVIFTECGIWGFNYDYCLGVRIWNLPVEEISFFFIIPFCSLFIHFALFSVFPNYKLSKGFTVSISIFLIVLSLVLAITYFDRMYTLVNYGTLSVVLVLGLKFQLAELQKFYISFFIILIPFFLVNGALTGIFTEIPVVWYDNLENLNFRIGSVPIEDSGYAFSMLFSNLMIYNGIVYFKSRSHVPLPQ